MGTKAEMIPFDTNYLIGLVSPNALLRPQIEAWFKSGEEFAISTIVWSEVLNGPLNAQQLRDAAGLVEGRILPFGIAEAGLASRLFNHTGRKRGSTSDCFIAAKAICARAPLATRNKKDFAAFTTLGLRLA